MRRPARRHQHASRANERGREEDRDLNGKETKRGKERKGQGKMVGELGTKTGQTGRVNGGRQVKEPVK